MARTAGRTAADKPMQDDLRRALGACRGAFAAMVLFSFFINLLLFVVPLYMLQIYDRVLSSRSHETLVMLTIVAGGLLLVLALLEGVRSRLLVRTGVRLDGLLNVRVFTSVFRSSAQAPGGGQVQALRDLDTVREFLTGSAIIAFCDAPWVPIFIAVGFLFHPLLGLVSLGGALIILALAVANEFLTRRSLQEATVTAINTNRFIESSLRNAEAIDAMGMMPAMLRRWGERHATVLGLQAQASDRAGSVVAASKSIRLGLQVAVLGVGAYLAIAREISPGTMIAASIIMARALAPVEIAVGQWRTVVSARSAFSRLRRLLAAVPVGETRMSLPRPSGEIAIDRVIAAPPGARAAALKGVSFSLAAGETLGVIGPSAAGKSTLARLLVGVWPAASGSVRLDGSDIAQWDSDELGRHIGYLPQDVELFEGTVAENISRFDEPGHEPVIAAALKAGAHEMIQRLPDGYDTPIGEGGRALSGGQRQRIALARTVYLDPAIVVLDEPNANLDAEGERALADCLATLKREKRTVVIVAHRPNLMASADKILVLADGAVEKFGSRDEVLAQYARPTVVAQRPSDGAQPATEAGAQPGGG